MVLRRQKIVREVNEEFRQNTKKSEVRNLSTVSERFTRQHPIVHELKVQQSSFYDKEHKYYEKVKSLKLRKF